MYRKCSQIRVRKTLEILLFQRHNNSNEKFYHSVHYKSRIEYLPLLVHNYLEMYHNTLLIAIAVCASLNPQAIFCEGNSILRDDHDDTHTNSYNLVRSDNDTTCPTWFIFNSTTGKCECGNNLGEVIICDSKYTQIYILNCHCMTTDGHIGVAVGSCATNCFPSKHNRSFESYYKLPTKLNDLNSAMCQENLHRGGRFCGKCKDDYYPLVYSYDMKCTQCSNSKYNWLKFVIAAYVPLTVFFIAVISIGISASSPQLDAFVVYSQTIASPANVRMVLEATRYYPSTAISSRLVGTLYGIWNLDFFRMLLPPICLKISTLQALTLDYLVAFYPLLLIISTYILIHLYDSRFHLIVCMWKPFRRFFKSFGNKINIKSSIINAFVTFLLLSYVKLLSTSSDLLNFTRAYSPEGKVIGTYLYYDASIEYFGKEHLPYGILAIIITVLFIILPFLLSILHPLRCLNVCVGRWPAFRICLDSYQGYYKDGTEGTRDCRCFSSLYLFARIALITVYGFIKNVYFYPFASILLLFIVALIVVCQPFKPQFSVYNTIHALLFLNLSTSLASVTCIQIKESYLIKLTLTLIGITASLPFLYITYLILKWIFLQKLVQKCLMKYMKSCYCFHETNRTSEVHQ